MDKSVKPIPAQTTLIFGATGAVGKELCRLMAGGSRPLILSSTNQQKLADLKQEIERINPQLKAEVRKFDMRKDAPTILGTLPELNTVLFCSGVHTGLKYIDQLTDAEIEESFQVNLMGLMKAARDVLAKTSEGSTIVFLNSMSIKQPARRNSALYEAQKAALHRFIQAYRNEAVLKKAKVIEVTLGLFESELTYNAYGGKDEFQKKFGKLDLLKPHDIAETILWIINNPQNIFITEINLTTVDQCFHSAVMS